MKLPKPVTSCASVEQNQRNRMPNTVRYVSCNKEDAQRRLLQHLDFPSGKAILRNSRMILAQSAFPRRYSSSNRKIVDLPHEDSVIFIIMEVWPTLPVFQVRI